MHAALRSNAFRLMSLPADADGKTVFRQQDRLSVRLRMETANQELEYGFVPALQLTPEDLLDAVHRIENQSSRQLEEMFWIHELGSGFDLRRKSSDEVLAQLRKEAKNPTTKGAVALHNAAVVLTLTALNSNGTKRLDYWRDAIAFWERVNENEIFWQFFEDRIALLDGPLRGSFLSGGPTLGVNFDSAKKRRIRASKTAAINFNASLFVSTAARRSVGRCSQGGSSF